MSSLSMFFGNIMALFENNIKRFFGYTSIAQLGYIFIVLLVSQKNYLFSLEAVGIYLISYFLSNTSFFGIISLLSNPDKKIDHDSMFLYRGLFWKKPVLAIMITIILLSLSGIPLTLGFIGKFYLLSIILQERLWFLGLSFLISTVIGIYCYLRLIFTLYSNID
ncbi:NADH-quinone oxidoreductase subunit N, partial [Buchnera aphidicola]|nr:NADH-quinone oxidoreductase subunit N [Buchnera aphidicola]